MPVKQEAVVVEVMLLQVEVNAAVVVFLHVDHLDLAVRLERMDLMDDRGQMESQELMVKCFLIMN